MATNTKSKISYNLKPIEQCVPVSFRYDVLFTNGLFQVGNPLLAQTIVAEGGETTRAIAVVDSGLMEHHPQILAQITDYINFYGEVLTLATEPMVVPGGESAKNDPQLLTQIHEVINNVGLCRHSYVLAIGGGAVLDMVGYAAATAHRGVRLIRIPTTALAQNDSSVGVKNGINAFGKKNFLGSFAAPYAVFNDFNFLTTLSDRDWRSGIAEAIKVALIKDADFFDFIVSNAKQLAQRDMEVMQQLIYRCAQLHLEHIATSGDAFEMGSSRPLDFGHWAAHKLEQLTDFRLRHGEAVAIGIALDSTYSYLSGLLSRTEWQQIINTLVAIGFTLSVPELAEQLNSPPTSRCLLGGLMEFREHLGGELTLMLLEGIGQGVEVHEVDVSIYLDAIRELLAL
ncbi:3-dehydroquinate synthase [Synechocystis sp. PCC 7509]|uniref:3-dehydroquinate synthase n=1 Tax=Synechocystis sp. PCC 7509 TaxID=927677 RepID=UPI0002AC9A41|nr:3-dehydroquinate synthase [Synechocystis sp. PCC 7509]